MAKVTKKQSELTLRDRLSRLSHQEVKKLLGEKTDRWLRAGGLWEIDIEANVSLDDETFELRLPDAKVTLRLALEASRRMLYSCDTCTTRMCDHIGAAFSLVLEEKVALGLARPPEQSVPSELLDEEQLEQRALFDRITRASQEKMTVEPAERDTPWTDCIVTNAASGRSYRVALRGLGRGASFCSCPDFRKNTLGTCKHILRVESWARRKFDADELARPYERKGYAVHIVYGDELKLHLAVPSSMGPAEAEIVGALDKEPVRDFADLLGRIDRLEALGNEVAIYPDAEELIQGRLFQARIARACDEIRKDPASHPLRRSLLEVELLPYQLDGIAFAARAGRAILADDMGLGKTIQGIGLAELLAREGAVSRVLVVCPTTLKSQWRTEVQRFSKRSVSLVLGSAAERAAQYSRGAFFTVCNYEQVLRDILAIEQVPWDLIILDEGQRIKNWEAQTARVIKGLKSPFALVLSGTPLENRLDELFSVAEFVDEQRLGPAFRFFHRHRMVDEKGKVLGFKDLGEVRARLAPVLLRRTRSSVLSELPPRTVKYVRIAPTAEQAELHDAHARVVATIIRKPFLTEMDFFRLRKALLMCRLAANGTFLVTKEEPNHSTKLAELEELLSRLAAEPDRKLVLFSEWTTMLGFIEPLLDRAGLGYVRLDGSIPQKQRAALVDRFQNDPTCRAFITTNAGSTGLNLQAANTVINVDLPWNPAVLEQRIARAHRMGQTQKVQVFVLVTEDTIEDRMLATLAAKKDLALAVLDAESEVDVVQLQSGSEELKRKLEELLGAQPDAAVDETVRADAERDLALRHKERVSLAGGQLLAAAFAFLGEVVPRTSNTDQPSLLAAQLKESLSGCLERDEQGRCRLSVTLPDSGVLDVLADAVARLAASAQLSTPQRSALAQ